MTRRWAVRVLLVSALAVSALSALSTLPAVAGPAAASAPWQPAARLSLGRAGDVACPTATACWAIAGGQLLDSGDGGASWTSQSARVPAAVDVLDALDCPLADTCYLAGRTADRSPVMLRLAPAGDLLVAVDSPRVIGSVSCSTARRCIASDAASVYGTDDAGVTWTRRGAPPLSSTWAVSCAPASTRCWAAGNSYPVAQVARSLDGGLTWRLQEQLGATSSFYGLDCPTTTTCLAVGQSGPDGVLSYTHDGGTTWSPGALPRYTAPLYSVACGSPTVCIATGGPAGGGFGQPFALGSADGGAHWSSQSLGGSLPIGASAGAPSVSCGSAGACAAVTRAGLGFATTTAGTSWTTVALPAGLTGVQRIDCPSATFCLGLGQDELLRRVAMISYDAGATWQTHVIGSSSGYLGSFECVSVTTCYAVTVTSTTFDGVHVKTVGQILFTSDGGSTWATNQSPDVRTLRSLSCVSASTCLGIGVLPNKAKTPVVLRTTDTFASWTSVPVPAGVVLLNAVQCAAVDACVIMATPGGAGGTVAEFTADLGDTYAPTTLPDSGSGFGRPGCAGLTCYAAASARDDYRGIVVKSVDGGASWNQQHVPGGATRLGPVACGTPRVCAIGANNGSQDGDGAEVLTTATGGRPWTVQPLPPPVVSFVSAVACAGSTCMESDYTRNDSPRIVRGMP